MNPFFLWLLRGTAFAMVLLSTAAHAAEPYPVKPIRIIVNSSPGALLDVTTRTVAQRMSEILQQPIVIDNVAGASGQLGIRQAKTAAPDGYTLLATSNTIAQVPALKLEPGYNLAKDFVGIGMINRAPLLLVGAPDLPIKTVAELISRAKTQPDTLSYASGGVGTSTHMAAALFLHQSGVKMLHVPFKGNAAALPDVLGSRVNILFDGLNSAAPYAKEGKLRALAITSPTRVASLPDIPTLAEQGLPDYSFFVYLGLVAPADTPKEVVQRLSQALKTALATEQVRERFKRDGAEPGTMSPKEFTDFLQRDTQRTVKLAADLGLQKE